MVLAPQTRVGYLTLLHVCGVKKLSWVCVCICGRTVKRTNRMLARGRGMSCGCRSGELRTEALRKKRLGKNNFRRASPDALYTTLYGVYKRDAAKRGLLFEIPFAVFACLTKENCHYCGRPPSSRMKRLLGAYTGLDRKNNGAYTVDEVLPACGLCNKAKGTTPYDEWIEHTRRRAVHGLKTKLFALAGLGFDSRQVHNKETNMTMPTTTKEFAKYLRDLADRVDRVPDVPLEMREEDVEVGFYYANPAFPQMPTGIYVQLTATTHAR